MTTTAAPSTASIYARISDDATGEGLGVDRQVGECKALAERLGLDLGEVYVDNDISATTGKRRPEFERLLAERPGGVVVVWHTDRLVRLTADLERVIEAGLTVHAVTAGHLDLSTPSGKAVARTVTAWATYEGEQKALRQKAAHRQMAEQGVPWGPAPFGYVKTGGGKGQPRAWVVEPEAADLVRAAFVDYLSGRSLSDIARAWNALGVTTSTGAQWRQASVSQIIANPAYAGLRYHGREAKNGRPQIVGRGDWDPIVTESTWRAAAARRSDPSRNSGGSATASYLMTGLAFCGRCGATVRKGQRPTDGVAFYRCNAHAHLSRTLSLVDEAVTEAVVLRLAQPDAMALPTDDPEAVEVHAELTALRQRRDDLMADYADGYVSRDDMRKGVARISARVTELERKAQRVEAAALAEFLPPADEADREAYVRTRWEAAPLHLRRKAVEVLADWWVLPAKGEGEVPADAHVLRCEIHNAMTRSTRSVPIVALRWR